MVGDYRHNSIFDFLTCYYILHCNEFVSVCILCCFCQFSDRIQKFFSNQIFGLPKLSVDLNFRVVSGFGELFDHFRLVLNTLHLRFVSGVFFASSSNFRTHSIFCYNFSRVGLVTTRHGTPGRGNIPC